MLCPQCGHFSRRNGRNLNGSQRYRYDQCRSSFTDQQTRPADRRYSPPQQLSTCLQLLLEGTSIRSLERVFNIHRDTIMSAWVIGVAAMFSMGCGFRFRLCHELDIRYDMGDRWGRRTMSSLRRQEHRP